jgi:hypothetical protein
MFFAHIRTIMDENFRNSSWYLSGQHYQDVIDAAVQQDTNKFYSYDTFRENLLNTVGAAGSQDEFPGIKDLMDARLAYLDSYPGVQGAPVFSGISHDPQYPAQGGKVTVTASIQGANHVLLGYRFNRWSSFQKTALYDDGNHNDSLAGDGKWSNEIDVKGPAVQFYIYAENDTAGRFAPERAEYEFYTIQAQLNPKDISINEIMPVNDVNPDENGLYSSWIEISNNTCNDISLKDVFLSDDKNDHERWQFPDTVITARGYLVAWADSISGETGIHTNFGISSFPERLYLANQSGSVIDSVVFSDVPENRSIGRYPNGTGPFTFMQPSFRAANFAGTTPQSDFLLYPNPASNKITVESKNTQNRFTLQVYNALGRLVREGQYSGTYGEIPVTSIELDVSGLAQGIYFMQVKSAGDIITKPFIKQ